MVERSGSNKNRRARWLCLCDCGSKKVLRGNSLISGNSKSCGCIQKETMHEIRWNHNLTQEEREANRHREMAFPGLHLWRKEVYKRDGWVCQACDDKTHNGIVAHHKDGWGICKERRLEVSNGVTLCKKCHKEFHDAYGWKNNTVSQWDKFIQSDKMRKVS